MTLVPPQCKQATPLEMIAFLWFIQPKAKTFNQYEPFNEIQ